MKRELINNPNKFSQSIHHVVDSVSAERIVKIIEPGFEGLSDFTDDKNNCYTQFFSRIVTAFPIDADRMDYLLRDSYFSGVTYGIYDINRIFASFIAARNDEEQVRLCFKESGLESMLRFIQSRSHLYNQVYFHKTNRAANTMLTYGTSSIRAQDGKSSYIYAQGSKLLDEYSSLKELLKFYITNSDEYFLNKTVINKLCKSNEEKKVIKELIRRKLFKRVYQKKIVIVLDSSLTVPSGKIKDLKKKIDDKLKSLEAENIYAVSDYYENITFKEADNKSIILAQKKKNQYEFITNWKEAGKEFEILNLYVGMLRVYLRRKNFNTSDEFKNFENNILEELQEEINELNTYRE